MTHDVFISHSSVNKSIADATCAALEQNGIRCWIAPRDVLPGNSYPAEIIRGIEGSRIVLFLFTSSSNSSPAVLRELERAFNHRKLILPFRLEDIDPCQDVEFLIAGQHWLNAIHPPLKTRIHELAVVVQRHLETVSPGARPSSPPVGQTAPTPSKSPRFRYALSLIVLLGLVGYGVWSYAERSSQSDLVHLGQPADHQVLIGNAENPSMTLVFELPAGHLNEEADVQLWPEGKSPVFLPPRSSASYRLPERYEGTIRWRVRAAWRDNGAVKPTYGGWSSWRTFEYYKSRLSKILRTGQCVIGTGDLSTDGALTKLDRTGRAGGYEVDLLQAFFDQEVAKDHLNKPVVISYLGEGWGDAYFHILERTPKVDLMAFGLTRSLEREQRWNVRFTKPTLKFYQVLLVRRDTTALSHGEIVLKRIGVADQTTNRDFLMRYFSREPNRVTTSPGPKFFDDLADRLSSRSIDGILIDQPDITTLEAAHQPLAQELNKVLLDPVENKAFEYSSVAYALRPNDDEFRERLDAFISANLKLEEALSRRYFPDQSFIR